MREFRNLVDGFHPDCVAQDQSGMEHGARSCSGLKDSLLQATEFVGRERGQSATVKFEDPSRCHLVV